MYEKNIYNKYNIPDPNLQRSLAALSVKPETGAKVPSYLPFFSTPHDKSVHPWQFDESAALPDQLLEITTPAFNAIGGVPSELTLGEVSELPGRVVGVDMNQARILKVSKENIGGVLAQKH